jgi:membrane-associated protein
LNLITNLDQELARLAQTLGPWVYLALFAYGLVQTGFLFGPIAPGSVVVFASGVIAATGSLEITTTVISLLGGAVAGNHINYFQGRRLGRAFFQEGRRWASPTRLAQLEAFFEKHGRNAMVISPFLPFVRSFAPFVAGVSRMDHRTYAISAFIGVLLWSFGLGLAGYFFGNVPGVRENLGYIVFGVVGLVLIKSAQAAFKAKKAAARQGLN